MSKLSPGSVVHVVPNRVKSSIRANQASIQLTVSDIHNANLDPLRWRNLHMLASAAAGSPITNMLVRPVNPRGNGYMEKFLENSSLHSRLVGLLKSLQLYDNESMHSFRRGMAQHLHAEGISRTDIMQRMLFKTPAVLHDLYLTR